MSNYSDYWLDEIDDFKTITDDSDSKSIDVDMIRLASAKRSIANFVQILTNTRIPVYFNNKDANLTDGEVVYLSADIVKKDDFDPSVGLALHEGSHILLSDFELLKTLWMKVPRSVYDITEPKNISKDKVIETVKFIWNIIEDRYIDDYIYRNAPGYRGYYIALYDKYFYSSKVDDMLKSKMYRSPSIDAYCARICNFMNKNTDLNALPDLKKIAEVIDIRNINRLKTANDRFALAFEVSEIVFKNIGNFDDDVNVKCNFSVNGDGDAKAGDNNDSCSPMDSDKSADDDELGGVKTGAEKVDKKDNSDRSIESDEGDTTGLKENKIKQIKNALDKQKKFVNGELKKKNVTVYQNKVLENIEKNGMVLEKVGKNLIIGTNRTIPSGIDCIVVKNITKELILSSEFHMRAVNYDKTPTLEMIEAVNKGVAMGNKLGNRLLLRNENNITKYMRKSGGKIDRRVISELGFDNDRIFCNMNYDKYNNAFIHISIDASSSMAGVKWYETMSAAIAICKACSMIENVKVSVSFRSTVLAQGNSCIPYVVMAYDSTKDKFSKIVNLFPYLSPYGTTPEGLAFEATLNMLKDRNREDNCYFLNFSDGEPYMQFNDVSDTGNIYVYASEPAIKHTKSQVNKIKEKGYQILSYYIRDSRYISSHGDVTYSNFKNMYGENAVFIDTNNVNAIAKTINEMFLKKDEVFS